MELKNKGFDNKEIGTRKSKSSKCKDDPYGEYYRNFLKKSSYQIKKEIERIIEETKELREQLNNLKNYQSNLCEDMTSLREDILTRIKLLKEKIMENRLKKLSGMRALRTKKVRSKYARIRD